MEAGLLKQREEKLLLNAIQEAFKRITRRQRRRRISQRC